MNGKEYNTQTFHYFDKRTNEEDTPLTLPPDVQNKYEQMERLFEEFFDDNSLSVAKVNHINNIYYFLLILAMFKRRTRQERFK